MQKSKTSRPLPTLVALGAAVFSLISSLAPAGAAQLTAENGRGRPSEQARIDQNAELLRQVERHRYFDVVQNTLRLDGFRSFQAPIQIPRYR